MTEWMTIISFIMAFVSILFTGVCAFFAFKAYATVIGLQNSTHQVQYVEFDPKKMTGKTGDDLVKEMKQQFYKDVDEEYV